MKNSKGQAATEFLMTYGWAILVVIVAIAALAYFGVMSPDRFMPEKCILEPGYQCVDYKVSPTEIDFVLKNAGGTTIQINSIAIGTCELTGLNEKILNSEQHQFKLTGCSNGDLGTKLKANIDIAYTKPTTNISKTMTGELVTKVQ